MPTPTSGPAVRLNETSRAYLIGIDLPGVKRNDVDVEIALDAKRLVVSGKGFTRSVPLQAEVDPFGIETELARGVLTITAPKRGAHAH